MALRPINAMHGMLYSIVSGTSSSITDTLGTEKHAVC